MRAGHRDRRGSILSLTSALHWQESSGNRRFCERDYTMSLVRTPSEILKAAITLDNRTQSAIARDSHISKAILSRFMSGQRGLSTRSFDRVAVSMGYCLKRIA